MAKFIIIFFILLGGVTSYLTYNGIGQEAVKTVEKESIRSNSHRSSWGSSSSYNSSSYGYGK